LNVTTANFCGNFEKVFNIAEEKFVEKLDFILVTFC